MAKKSTGKKTTTAPKSEATELPAPMKSKIDHIHDYVKAHPKATAKEVVAGLKEIGVEVSEGYVSNNKPKKGKRGRPAGSKNAAKAKGKPGRKPKAATTAVAANGATDALSVGLDLIAAVGGVSAAQALIARLKTM